MGDIAIMAKLRDYRHIEEAAVGSTGNRKSRRRVLWWLRAPRLRLRHNAAENRRRTFAL